MTRAHHNQFEYSEDYSPVELVSVQDQEKRSAVERMGPPISNFMSHDFKRWSILKSR